MSAEIKIPAVGESVSTGFISQWHKANGDQVATGDLLITLETDKISTEIVAEADGILEIISPEGDEVPIGAVVGRIGSAAPSAAPAPAPEPEPVAQPEPSPAPVVEAAPAPAPVQPAPQQQLFTSPAPAAESAPAKKKKSGRKAPVSPVVKRLAKENGVDLSLVVGNGKNGAILKKDVQAYIAAGGGTGAPVAAPTPTPAAATPAPAAKAPAPAAKASPLAKPDLSIVPAAMSPAVPASTEDNGRITRKRLSPLRRKIASQLVAAQTNAALLTTFNECDMSQVMKLRKDVQEGFVAKHGVKLGFMSIFIKAVVDALKEVPSINARMDGDDLIVNHFYDVGVAVGTEKGLVVPVVRDCDQKSFAQLEQDIIGYAGHARDGKLVLADLQGGVFTISNGGVYGSMLSTPIVNPPQSGILGMHNIIQRPVAVDGEVVIRPMMYLALSYDHRIVDGKEAVTFLNRVKDCIENPMRLLVGA